MLAQAGLELAHRLTGAQADFHTDGVVDGPDFLVWQRGFGRVPAQPSSRTATMLLRCDYLVADDLVTRVSGSETEGAVSARLAAALAGGPSCAGAYVLLADAGLGLVSGEAAPVADGISAGDLAVWRESYGAGAR